MSRLLLLVLLAGAARGEPERVVVRVTAEGTVHWDGERIRLAELVMKLRGHESSKGVLVDAESDAAWAHVQWVLALFPRQGPDEVLLARDGEDATPIRLPLLLTMMIKKDPKAFGRLFVRIGRDEQGAARYTFGQRTTTDLHQAQEWLTDAASLLDLAGYVAIEAHGNVPFRDLHPVLKAAWEIEHIRPEVGLEEPHPWTMLQDPLPESERLFRRWVPEDPNREQWRGFSLPLARKSEPWDDEQADQRLIYEAAPSGAILYRGDPLDLERFALTLRDARRTYGRIRRMHEPDNPHAGEERLAEGVYASKLFVVLRVDHRTPWQHVRNMLDTLEQRGFFKVELATQKYATFDHSPELARRLGMERVEVASTMVPGPLWKLDCYLPLVQPEGDVRHLDVEITPERKYRFGDVETDDPIRLAKLIRDRYGALSRDEKVLVMGRVIPQVDTPYQLVICVVDAFLSAGVTKLDLL